VRVFLSACVLAGALALVIGCSSPQTAKIGDRVKIEYVGKTDDGVVFDSTTAGQGIDFVIGQRQVIPGFENAVVGMAVGETKSVSIPPEEAYGPHRPELTHTYPADSFPDNIQPELGMQLQMQTPDGQPVTLVITAIDRDSNVTVDANHHLAGKTLLFDLKLVEIMAVAGDGAEE